MTHYLDDDFEAAESEILDRDSYEDCEVDFLGELLPRKAARFED